jgi:hypothetical protein
MRHRQPPPTPNPDRKEGDAPMNLPSYHNMPNSLKIRSFPENLPVMSSL